MLVANFVCVDGDQAPTAHVLYDLPGLASDVEIQRVCTFAADFDAAGLIAHFLYGLSEHKRQLCLVHVSPRAPLMTIADGRIG